jgi:zinc transport system permease protein
LLGILSHAALSIGLVIASFLTWVKFDLMALLFGDILAVTRIDLVMIYAGGALGLCVLAWLWRPLLVVSIHEDIAKAEGIEVARIRFVFMLLIAFIVAVAMKVVGIVLITSLLIIPAAAARAFSKTPEQMAILAAVIGMISVVFGLGASLQFDTPSGPSIVLAATCAFLVSLMWHGIARGWRGKWFVRQ